MSNHKTTKKEKTHDVETPAPQPPESSGAEPIPADDPRRAPPPETRNAQNESDRLVEAERQRQEDATKTSQ